MDIKCYDRRCDYNNIDNTCMYQANKMKCQVNCCNCINDCKKIEGDIACYEFKNKNEFTH